MAAAVIESGSTIATLGALSDRLFQCGSISKCVSAFVALRLVNDGMMELDAPLNASLRSWRIPNGDVVTLRALLTHTAGVGVPFFPGYGQDEDMPTVLQVLDGISPANTSAVRIDGTTEFRYSGGGYVIVQQAIEDVTGESFERVAQEVVFKPLAMSDSTFEQPPPESLAERAARADWNLYPELAAAGLWSTPRDLATFVSAIQNPGAGPDSTVPPVVADLMTRPAAVLPPEGDWAAVSALGLRAPDRYGMGFFLEGEDRFSHLGGASGFFAMLTASKRNGTGAVVMSAAQATPRLFEVLIAISDQYGWTGFATGE